MRNAHGYPSRISSNTRRVCNSKPYPWMPSMHIVISKLSYDKFKEVQVQEWKGTENENKEPYKLVQEVPTRWNSCLYMIQRILKTSESLNKALLKIRKAPAPLTIDEISILGDFEKLLGCFEEATKKISGTEYVTILLIIPIVYGIHNTLISEITGTEIGNNFRLELIESISKRLFQYESRSITRISTIIDPRFKKEAFRMKENADQASILLENEMTVLARKEKCFKSGNESNDEFEKPKPKRTLFDFMEEKVKGKVKNVLADVVITKRQFLERQNASSETDPLLFWKVNGTELFPIQELALKYLQIPGSSVESERNFGAVG
ncbi:zinc finger BED domain-containing protein 4-like [Diabrotica undecimpunctata]|uniref:zinc finger BED domain-containing protein 4-like n=1 Tax=Diabrotica undecimpunctata TaxID=50387 RepID=UPI003B638030